KKYENFKRFSNIKERKIKLDDIREKFSQAENAITFDGEMVSSQSVLEMEKRQETRESLLSEKENLEKEILSLSERKKEEEKSKTIYEEISFDIESIKTKEEKIKEKKKKSKTLGIFFLILGALSLILLLVSPYFSFLTAIFVALEIIVLPKEKADFGHIMRKYGVLDIEGLLEKKATLAGEIKAFEYLSKDMEEKNQRIKDIEEKLSHCLGLIKSDLKKFGKDEDADYKRVIEEIKILVTEYIDIKNRKEILEESYKASSHGFEFSKEEIKEFEKLSEDDLNFSSRIDENSLNIKRQNLSKLAEEILDKRSQVDKIYLGKELPSQILSKINFLDNEISKMEKNYKSVKLSMEVLSKAEEEIKSTFAPVLNQKATEMVGVLSDNRYDRIFIDEDYNITAQKEGKTYGGNYLSTGMADAVFFSVRSAISELIYSSDMPMFFDDSFVYMDDERLKNMGRVLSDMGEKRQLFIFTCQKREEEFVLADKVIKL
ncbi:MAG: hypothetical protein IKZ25_00070, partial [Clostridia bacterium]|nr:hypothetical protein [Clostridia bacterium]